MMIELGKARILIGSVSITAVPGDAQMLNLSDETGGQTFSVSTIEKALKALLTPLPVASIPSGWKLVPTEPTKDMRSAAQQIFIRTERDQLGQMYRAMVAASPSQPSEPSPSAAQSDASTEKT